MPLFNLYGLEGFAPARHCKEDGKTIGADEVAQFMVIEFDRNDKRIVLKPYTPVGTS